MFSQESYINIQSPPNEIKSTVSRRSAKGGISDDHSMKQFKKVIASDCKSKKNVRKSGSKD